MDEAPYTPALCALARARRGQAGESHNHRLPPVHRNSCGALSIRASVTIFTDSVRGFKDRLRVGRLDAEGNFIAAIRWGCRELGLCRNNRARNGAFARRILCGLGESLR